MSTIKPKVGKCCDCPDDAPDKYLTASRCKFHYWSYRQSLKPIKENKYIESRSLDKWFASQINIMPHYCEECGEYLNPNAPWGARTYIAHILPKRTFKSVMIHPMNKMFYCGACHTNFDNWGIEKVVKMKTYPLVLQRLIQFLHQLNIEEVGELPAYYQEIYYKL